MTDHSIPVVTIDGPSGSGKGTVSQQLAKKLGFALLDSGSLYRITAVAADRQGIDFNNEAALVKVVENLDITFESTAEGVIAVLDGQDVTTEIRSEKASFGSSVIAAHSAVRSSLLIRQRQFRKAPGLVADGRDMGTTVFPDAPVKIFLTASVEERASRRYRQLLNRGESANLGCLMESVSARDARDMQRSVSPLRAANDAVKIDSTSMPVQAVFDSVVAVVNKRLAIFEPDSSQ